MRPPILLLLATVIVGCSDATEGPPEIIYGVEECYHCRMIVNEEKYAAAIREPSGIELKFDDLGCLLAYRQAVGRVEADIWVHDAGTGAWLTAESAWFVRTDRAATPMGSGVMAFADRDSAEARAEEGDTVYDWREILGVETSIEYVNKENG